MFVIIIITLYIENIRELEDTWERKIIQLLQIVLKQILAFTFVLCMVPSKDVMIMQFFPSLIFGMFKEGPLAFCRSHTSLEK